MSPLLMGGTLPAPVVEEMLMAPESETVEPDMLTMAAAEPAVETSERPSLLARVRGWFTLPQSEAA
jgi:hypothetical protein